MAGKQESTAGMGRTRTALLTLLVIGAVVAAIQFVGGSDQKPVTREFVDDDVVEVAPLVPASRMSGASWRSAEQVRDERDAEAEDETKAHGESALDRAQWSEDEGSRAYDKSVEETVRGIDGLGVYIVPSETARKTPAKQPQKKDGAK